jgi:asparagine synthase (glutamine-hydrolysing)
VPAKDRKLLERIRDKNLTPLSRPRLVSALETCRSIEDDRIEGAFLEVGCGLGGLSILIASAKYPMRPFRVYDLFETPTKDAADGDREDLSKIILDNFKSFGVDPGSKCVTFIKGPLRETMKFRGPVAFAHVDVEGYDSVMTCLTRVIPKLSPGGGIILDDYHDRDDCREATDECLKGIEDQFTFDDSAGSMKLTKLAR